MDKFIINGPCKIEGIIKLSGSKNASLPILAATILFDEPVEIKNLPNVKDIFTMLDLIKSLGFSVQKNNTKSATQISHTSTSANFWKTNTRHAKSTMCYT